MRHETYHDFMSKEKPRIEAPDNDLGFPSQTGGPSPAVFQKVQER